MSWQNGFFACAASRFGCFLMLGYELLATSGVSGLGASYGRKVVVKSLNVSVAILLQSSPSPDPLKHATPNP